MKKSFAKIRHIQEVNQILDVRRRVLKEQEAPPPAPATPQSTDATAPSTGNTSTTQVKKCQELMTNSGAPGASSTLNVTGNITVEYRGTVSPEFQGYYINVDAKPYCFIPVK